MATLETKESFKWEMRLSQRAKRPRITISAYGKVELVWPVNMSVALAPSMLRQHKSWVEKQLDKLCNTKRDISPPQYINFESISEKWLVKYKKSESKRITIKEDGDSLLVQGDILQQEALRKVLCLWIKQRGKQHLSKMLADVAAEMGLPYASVSIRLQKKRWGSCSVAKRISLNAALLFLPAVLVRHVLVHELTHLKHLNHSADFWLEVEKHDANYLENRRLLRQYSELVPAWLTEAFTEPCNES